MIEIALCDIFSDSEWNLFDWSNEISYFQNRHRLWSFKSFMIVQEFRILYFKDQRIFYWREWLWSLWHHHQRNTQSNRQNNIEKKKEKRKSIYSKVLEENWLRKKKKRKEIKWERKFWYYFGGKIFFEKLLLIIFVPQRCIFVSNDPWKQNEIVSRIHNFLLFWFWWRILAPHSISHFSLDAFWSHHYHIKFIKSYVK